MAAPLAHDLRIRIVDASNKMKQVDVAKIFGVSIKTVQRLVKQMREEGNVKAKSGYQKGHSHKMTDIPSIRGFIEKKPHVILKDVGKQFGVSISTAHRKIRQLGISKKKLLRLISKEMMKREKNLKRT
jgi:transposase